jgi:hypothetical protein
MRTLIVILLVLWPLRGTAQGAPSCAAVSHGGLIAGPAPLSTSPLPEYPEILAYAGVHASVIVRFQVDGEGSVVRGSLCQEEGEYAHLLGRSIQTVAAWRYPPSPAHAEIVELQFTGADTIRKVLGQVPTLASAPALTRRADGVRVLGIPVRIARYSLETLRPLTELGLLSRDSAMLAVVRTLTSTDTLETEGIWCVDAEADSWLARKLMEGLPAFRLMSECVQRNEPRRSIRVAWEREGDGISQEGIVYVHAERERWDSSGCGESVLCGSFSASEFDCMAARTSNDWIAECRHTGRLTLGVS